METFFRAYDVHKHNEDHNNLQVVDPVIDCEAAGGNRAAHDQVGAGFEDRARGKVDLMERQAFEALGDGRVGPRQEARADAKRARAEAKVETRRLDLVRIGIAQDANLLRRDQLGDHLGRQDSGRAFPRHADRLAHVTVDANKEAAYAWLNFIQDPPIQGDETNINYYATANDEAKKFVDPAILADPTVFVPDEVIPKLEGAADVSTNPLRVEIWEEFVSSIGHK